MSETVCLLLALAIGESFALVWRYRAAQVRRFGLTAGATFAVCTLGIGKAMLGAAALLEGTPFIVAVAAYAVPAALVSGWLERRKEAVHEPRVTVFPPATERFWKRCSREGA